MRHSRSCRCALLPPRRRAHAAPAWDRGERPTQWWLTHPRPYRLRLGPVSPDGPQSSWRSRQACQRGKPHSQGHSRSCVLRVVCAHSYASWVRREGAPVRPDSARGLFASPVAGGEFVTPSAKTAPLGITLRAAKGRSSRCPPNVHVVVLLAPVTHVERSENRRIRHAKRRSHRCCQPRHINLHPCHRSLPHATPPLSHGPPLRLALDAFSC